MDDAKEIEDLIRRWAAAVHRGDMEAVLADHEERILMFDVPPPEDGVRGLAAYRATWVPFFAWQRSGGSFEIVELDVTAGDAVAYATALLRCASADERARHPDRRLRLTVGLRKRTGRWTVCHEHHSFTDRSSEEAP